MALNKTLLYGRLVRDVELKQTPNGVSVVKFTVAVDRSYKNNNGEKITDFIECQAWRNTTEFIAKYFHKGSAIIVEGSIYNNNYESNGVKHYSYIVQADNVYFGESKNSTTDNSASSVAAPAPSSPQNVTAGGYDFEIIADGDLPF